MSVRIIYAIVVMLAISGCAGHTSGWRRMDEAAALMEERPDSALAVLEKIAEGSLRGEGERARHALLLSMALDKNYVDTATFDVLRPAIDYYLEKGEGSGDDRLRTLYYQGRIYQNRGDDSRAMVSFFRASEVDGITDTLTLARTYVAQSVSSDHMYRSDDVMKYALNAAMLYGVLGRHDVQLSCYYNALNASLLSDNEHKADSILSLCEILVKSDSESVSELDWHRLVCALEYGSDEEIQNLIDKISADDELPDWVLIYIARGYLKLSKPDLAEKYIDSIDDEMYGSVQYLVVKSEVYEANGMYKEALDLFKEYSSITGEAEVKGAGYDMSFAKDQYAKDIKVLEERQRKNSLILGILICTLALIVAVGVLYHRHILVKTRMSVVEADNERLRVSQELMSKEKENLLLEKRHIEHERDMQALLKEKKQNESALLEKEKQNIETERDRQSLIAENMRLQISQMENEICSLRELLDRKESMADCMKEAVVERISMLNSLMAYEISYNGKHADAYKEWKERMLKDCEMFMNSTRLAYTACNPKFITYLEEHGLTEPEINYTCLYALGLNGKEVGNYIHLQRHYHISSEIRKKLGMETNGTNFGNYVRRLMNER